MSVIDIVSGKYPRTHQIWQDSLWSTQQVRITFQLSVVLKEQQNLFIFSHIVIDMCMLSALALFHSETYCYITRSAELISAFYRDASTERGYEIACCPSVRLSVCLFVCLWHLGTVIK